MRLVSLLHETGWKAVRIWEKKHTGKATSEKNADDDRNTIARMWLVFRSHQSELRTESLEELSRLLKLHFSAAYLFSFCHCQSVAMSDDEMEEFSISDRDLQSAFNPTRRRGRQSKAEATYGEWKRLTTLLVKRNLLLQVFGQHKPKEKTLGLRRRPPRHTAAYLNRFRSSVVVWNQDRKLRNHNRASRKQQDHRRNQSWSKVTIAMKTAM